MTDEQEPPFRVGDAVQKKEGYRFPGFITAFDGDSVTKCIVTTYHPEFVGMKHIFSIHQLEKRTREDDGDLVRKLELENKALRAQMRKSQHERH